jgi:hypothetical protein
LFRLIQGNGIAGEKPYAGMKKGLKISGTGRISGKSPALAAGKKPDGKCLWPKSNFKMRSGCCSSTVSPQVMSAHFSFLAGSIDIKLPIEVPNWVGYTILTAGVLIFATVGVLIYRVFKRKR